MAVIHDIKCDSCGLYEEDALLDKDPETRECLVPECPECGSPRHWVPVKFGAPSTLRREAPNEHFVGKGGFAMRDARERQNDHAEERRKGNPGNQDEFPEHGGWK
jgi:hypothetical protein